MCLHQDRSAGSLINAAGFHADNTILYDIDDADAVLCAQLVQSADDVGNLHLYTVYALRNAFFKGHGNIFCLVGSFLGSAA